MNVVTQENIRSIIPAKAARVSCLYAKKYGVTPLEALKKFYASPVYKKLEKEETKVWWESPEELLWDLS